MWLDNREKIVARSGCVHIWSQLIIPSQDCIFAVRGALSSDDMSIDGIVSTGNPDRKGVMRGVLLALERPISSTIATTNPS